MADGSLARRYARALVDIGRELDAVDALAADLDRFVDSVLDAGDGLMRKAMGNPGLTKAERRSVLDAVLDQVGLHPMVANFLKLLVDKGRFGALDSIRLQVHAMADDLAGRSRATVHTARQLDAATAAEVQAALSSATGRQVTVDFQVDAALIGGMVAKVGDTVYDASVRTRLADIQHALTHSPGQAVAEA